MSHPWMDEVSQVEICHIKGRDVYVRRDDLAYHAPLPPNAKMAALYNIVKHAYALGHDRVVMFAKKQQGMPYAVGLPPICKEFGMECWITYPSNKFETLPWMVEAQRFGNCFFEFLHPNMITVNVNQSKKLAERLKAYFIPFGFDDPISVETHASKFELPQHVGTLVLSTMTGMILAGTLKQIYTRGYNVERVYGISSGRSEMNIHKSIMKYLDPNKLGHLHLSEAYPRDFKVDQSSKELFPFPVHPDYEAKAWNWLLDRLELSGLYEPLPDPIWFINSGR